MNKVLLIGRLTDDVKCKVYGKGKDAGKYVNFTVAVDRPGKDQPADFIRCVAFNSTAEFLEKYTGKGIRIAIEGSWQTGSYEDKETGKTVYTNDCYVQRVEFADGRKDDDNNRRGRR